MGGQTVTGGLLTITGTTPGYTIRTSFAPSEASSYVGVAIEGLGILVHQASDILKTPTATASSTPKGNSAGRIRDSGNGLGVVAIVVSCSFVLGALLIL
jgi:hypothetical protein